MKCDAWLLQWLVKYNVTITGQEVMGGKFNQRIVAVSVIVVNIEGHFGLYNDKSSTKTNKV